MDRPGNSASASADIGRPEPDRRFDRWTGSHDLSQLQTALYGPVHDAALWYARQHVPCQGMILDFGCGTGRLPARLASAYRQAPAVA